MTQNRDRVADVLEERIRVQKDLDILENCIADSRVNASQDKCKVPYLGRKTKCTRAEGRTTGLAVALLRRICGLWWTGDSVSVRNVMFFQKGKWSCGLR